MAKLDEKALEKLIREVLSESQVDDTLKDQIKAIQGDSKLESLKKDFSTYLVRSANDRFDIHKNSNFNFYKVFLGTLKARADKLNSDGINLDSTAPRDITKIKDVFGGMPRTLGLDLRILDKRVISSDGRPASTVFKTALQPLKKGDDFTSPVDPEKVMEFIKTNLSKIDEFASPLKLAADEKTAPRRTKPEERLGVSDDLDIIDVAINGLQVDNNSKQQILQKFKDIVFGGNETLLNKIKGIAEVKDKLEPIDFDIYFDAALAPEQVPDNTPNADEINKIQRSYSPKDGAEMEQRLKQFYNQIPDGEPYLNLKNVVSALIKKYRETAATRTSQGTLSGYTITSRSASDAKIDVQIIDAFSKAFGANTFAERLQQFNDYVGSVARFISDPKEKIEGSMGEKFSRFITLDLMQQILYAFEASSAGWVFESFLAFMAHGNAIGASYGAGDFSINDGGNQIEGSAKLLQKDKSSQSTKNWPIHPAVGSRVRYVVGEKQTVTDTGEFGPTTQADRTGKLTMYVFDIVRTSKKNCQSGPVGFTPTDDNSTPSGGKLVPIDSDDRIDIYIPSDEIRANPTGVVNLIFLQVDEFEDYSGLIVRDISEQLEKAMLYMSEMKSNIDDYVLRQDDDHDMHYYSKEAMKNHSLLKSALAGESGKSGLFKQMQVTESKFAQLDKLILEVLKNNS